MPENSGYWYAPIIARPIPELPDRVTVGLVFGNGRLERLEVDENFDRLKGLWSSDHRALLAFALEHAAGQLTQLRTVNDLRSLLGVQFIVDDPRPLLQPYTKNVIRSLRRAHLAVLESPRARMDGLQRESLIALDREVDAMLPPKLTYLKKTYQFKELYAGVAERHETAQIPSIRRMVRGDHRDLIMSSVIVRMHDRAHLDQTVQRTIRQFYFVDKLRKVIQDRSGVVVRTIGVIQPLESDATSETRQLREMIAEQWDRASDHLVILNTRSELREQISDDIEWASVRAPHAD